MNSIDLMTWKNLANDHLSRFTNKAERTAFLVGLSLGARETDSPERLRVCQDLKSLYNIDLERPAGDKTVSPAKPRVRPPVCEINPDLMARLKALKGC